MTIESRKESREQPPSPASEPPEHEDPGEGYGLTQYMSPEFIDDLAALPNLSYPDHLLDSGFLDNPANDIFLPGSAYEALHTALRNRQLWTARPDPSRSPTGTVPDAPKERARGRFEPSPDRENVLWQNYLNEICLWVCVRIQE